MKKFLALVLAMMMVLAMGTVAFAAADTGVAASTAKTLEFDKNYTVTTSNETYKVNYPSETLSFTVVKAAGNTNPDDTMISIDNQGIDANPDTLTINVPSYTTAGTYNYTISEVAGNTQGVEYTNATFNVQVLVTYNTDHTALESTVSFTTVSGTDENGENIKVDEITNIYKLGHLEVKKTVSGNLASQDEVFEVDVTFEAAEGKVVRSAITYVDGEEVKTISINDMADGEETVTITVKHNETVYFYNIPEGVTYTVDEHDYTEGDKNVALQGYDAPTYNGSASENATGTISTTTSSVVINNHKNAGIDTGIVMDNAPYMMIMAMVVLAGAAMMMKRRAY